MSLQSRLNVLLELVYWPRRAPHGEAGDDSFLTGGGNDEQGFPPDIQRVRESNRERPLSLAKVVLVFENELTAPAEQAHYRDNYKCRAGTPTLSNADSRKVLTC